MAAAHQEPSSRRSAAPRASASRTSCWHTARVRSPPQATCAARAIHMMIVDVLVNLGHCAVTVWIQSAIGPAT